MPDRRISELPAADVPLDGDELLPVVQGAVTKQATVTQLRGAPQITVSADPPADPVLNQLWVPIAP